MYNSSSPTVANCIFWGDCTNGIAGGTPTVSFSNVQDGWEAERNIDADPMLVDPDYDCNRLVDMLDFEQSLACYTGPDGGPYPSGCEAFDADADGDVDWSDFATIQLAFTGP